LNKVTILPYNENWPAEFQTIAAGLRRTLGPLALRIDHIGSTSVPELAAKDVIDFQITVTTLEDVLLSKMLKLGYTQWQGLMYDHIPPLPSEESMLRTDQDWEKWLFTAPSGQCRTHIHVRVQGQDNQNTLCENLL
jgi:GrpB-like predicted nucleotidyltransferase (UPF0157 family)